MEKNNLNDELIADLKDLFEERTDYEMAVRSLEWDREKIDTLKISKKDKDYLKDALQAAYNLGVEVGMNKKEKKHKGD